MTDKTQYLFFLWGVTSSFIIILGNLLLSSSRVLQLWCWNSVSSSGFKTSLLSLVRQTLVQRLRYPEQTLAKQRSPTSHGDMAFIGPLLEAEYCLPPCRRKAKSRARSKWTFPVVEIINWQNNTRTQPPKAWGRLHWTAISFIWCLQD